MQIEHRKNSAAEKAENLVSVIIPTFNAIDHIDETLASVFAQSYPLIEVIVVDDGSTDNTLRTLEKYQSKITVIAQKNAGVGAARNNGARAARGEFLAFMDHDDVLDSSKIDLQVALLKEFPQALATYCDHRTIDETGNLIGSTGALNNPRPSGDILTALLSGARIITPAVSLVRKQAWELVSGFRDGTEVRSCEDYDFWLRLSAKGAILYMPKTLVSYRLHEQQMSQQADYLCGRAKAHLNCARAISDIINQAGDQRKLNFYKLHYFEQLLEAAWEARQNRNTKEAFRYALEACSLRLYEPSAWAALVKSLFVWPATAKNEVARTNNRN